MKVSNLTYFMLGYFVDDPSSGYYRIRCEELIKKGLSLEVLFDEAKINKVSFQLAKKLKENRLVKSGDLVDSLIEDGDNGAVKLKNTLIALNNILGEKGIEFLVIKTYKTELFVTADIDIIVKSNDYEEAIIALENKGFSKGGGRFFRLVNMLQLGTPDFIANGMLTIDFYGGIPWKGFSLMDEEFLWQEPRVMNFEGVRYLIPNPEADFLSIVLSTIFTDVKLTFLDYSYLNSLIDEGLDYQKIHYQANKFYWSDTFNKYILMLCNLKNRLRSEKPAPLGVKFPIPVKFSFVINALLGPVFYLLKNRPKDSYLTLINVAYRCFFGRFYYKAHKILKKFI
jgi:hypothetical protein